MKLTVPVGSWRTAVEREPFLWVPGWDGESPTVACPYVAECAHTPIVLGTSCAPLFTHTHVHVHAHTHMHTHTHTHTHTHIHTHTQGQIPVWRFPLFGVGLAGLLQLPSCVLLRACAICVICSHNTHAQHTLAHTTHTNTTHTSTHAQHTLNKHNTH